MTRYVELMRECPLRPIKTERQNDRALKVIEGLLDQRKMTRAEKDYLQVLGLLVHDYEETAYPIGDVSPQEMLKGLMENHNLTQSQLSRETGIPQPRISLILKGKGQMGVKTIDKLAKRFKVSPAAFHDAA